MELIKNNLKFLIILKIDLLSKLVASITYRAKEKSESAAIS